MGQFFKWVMIGLVLLLIVSADLLVVYKNNWPYWTFLVILLGIVVSIFTVSLILRIYHRWKRHRIARKAEQKQTSVLSSRESQARIRHLQQYWKETIRSLRKAKIKGKGNPINDFPWYLSMGSESVGKSTAIKNSRVAIPFSDIVPGFRNDPAQSCNWWFLDDAILLDTPGRFCSHRDETDNAEWRKLLYLIESVRKESAINGIVLNIPVDSLMSGNSSHMQQIGVNLRRRIDDVMQILGIRCPIYVLITKLDQISGMTQFFNSFPDVAMNQAMGAINTDMSSGSKLEKIINRGFKWIYNDLNQLRLILLGAKNADEIQPQTLLFPEEIVKIKDPLLRVLTAVFEENPYQESPLFRGVYFSSGHQEGVPFSNYLSRLGFESERHPLSVTNISYFLRDFFGRILVQDQNLVAPTSMALRLRRLGQNLGLTTWGIVCVLCAILLSFSFIKNLSVIQSTVSEIPPSVNLSHEFSKDFVMLSEFRNAISHLVKENDMWWMPRLGLSHSFDIQHDLQTIYSGRFRIGILQILDRTLDRSLSRLTSFSPPLETASHIDYMSKRIKLLRAYLDDELDEDERAEIGRPDFMFLTQVFLKQASQELEHEMRLDYISYLQWHQDKRLMEEEFEQEKQRIRKLITKEGIGLMWLTDWGNMQDGLQSVSAKQFWGVDVYDKNNQPLKIPSAFTEQGWHVINQFIEEIEEANRNDELLLKNKENYIDEYRKEYFNQWRNFLLSFKEGEKGWQGRANRIELAARIASKDSPYTQLLNFAPKGLEPAIDLATNIDQIPEWVLLIKRFGELSDVKYQQVLKTSEGVLGRLANQSGRVVRAIKAEIQGAKSQRQVIQDDQKSLPHWKSYNETLIKVSEVLQQPKAAYQLAKTVYEESDVVVGEPKQLVSKNFWDQKKLKGILGNRKPSEEVFWQLLSNQTEYLWQVLLDEAEIHIQQLWEQDVLAYGVGLTGWELVETMQGFDGKVWEFQNKSLAPFMLKSPRKGYRSRELFGSSISFSRSFLALMGQGKISKDAFTASYSIKVSAKPTDTNAGAIKGVHETRLVIQCAAGNQELENHNYPITKTVNWAPQDCTEVNLEIIVGDSILRKRYQGYRSFISFLNDFRGGRKVFGRMDFPQQVAVLAGYRIRSITVHYNFSGHNSILALASRESSKVPEKIVLTNEKDN